MPALFVIWLSLLEKLHIGYVSLSLSLSAYHLLFLLLSIWFDWFCNGRLANKKKSSLKISILLHLCVIFCVIQFPFICLFVEILGSSGVNANGGSTRMTSNTLNQQSSSSTTRQQSNHGSGNSSAMGDATHSNMGSIIVPSCKIQLQLTDMPVEIFERIFQYTGYKEVSNMRLVKETKHLSFESKVWFSTNSQCISFCHFISGFNSNKSNL